jgi:hypothetical protein
VITQIFEALKEPFTAIGRWLNPDRKREQIKDQALSAAQEIINILDRAGKYDKMQEKLRLKWRKHYQKQFDQWRDGVA